MKHLQIIHNLKNSMMLRSSVLCILIGLTSGIIINENSINLPTLISLVIGLLLAGVLIYQNRNEKKISGFFYLSCVIIIAAVGIFTFNSLQLWNFTVDDSFITYRYAKNLVDGVGLTYNPDGLPVEGYTSVLWVLVMVPPHLIGSGVIVYAKLVSIFFSLGTIFILIQMVLSAGKKLNQNLVFLSTSVIVFFLGASPEFAVHTISGMETAMFTFLLILFVFLVYQSISNKNIPHWLIGFIGLLTGLTRPEANLIVFILLMINILFSEQKKPPLLNSIISYVLPGAVYFIWRWLYYGVLLPLPFYVKTGSENLLPGLPVISSFLSFIGIGIGFLIFSSLFENKKPFLIITTVSIPLLVFFLFPAHLMGYDWRYVFPLLPLLLVLAGHGLSVILNGLSRISQGTQFAASLLVLTIYLTGFLGYQQIQRSPEIIESHLGYADGLQSNHIAIGKILQNSASENTLIAVKDAGAIPYYSGLQTLDLVGLNEPSIALDHQDPVTLFTEKKPDVLVMLSNNNNNFSSDSQQNIDFYETAISFGLEPVWIKHFNHGEFLWVLAEPESEIGKSLLSHFE